MAYGKLVGKVLGIEYQRNGISGEGFHQVEFLGAAGSDVAGRHFFGIVFPLEVDEKTGKPIAGNWNGRVAIVSPETPTEHWRGDHFEEELRKIVAADEDRKWQQLNKRSKR